MEYILNKSPIWTTNNFKVNDFKIDLDIVETKFKDFKYKNLDIKTEIRNNLESKVGQLLTFSRNVSKSNSDEPSTSDRIKKLYNEIDEICFELFKLTPENITLIKQCINCENLFLPL